MRRFYFLQLLIIFITSCNGQVINNHPEDKKPATNKQIKLPKAHGLFKDASVGCAIQDKAGNLWFGTNGEGLFRYDGKTFTSFTEKEGLDNSIIYSILEDNGGNIWVGTKTGLNRYNGKTFTHIPIIVTFGFNFYSNTAVKVSESPINGVWSIMQTKQGTIWFGTDNGVYCYNGSTFTYFLNEFGMINKDSLHLKSIFSLVEDNGGNIWFGSCIGEGLIKFDGKILSRVSPKGYSRTQNIVEDKKGNIWFASIGKYMCCYNGKTINTNFFNEKEKDTYGSLYTILKDKAGNLWFCQPYNNRDLCYYDGNEIINFSKTKTLPNNKMYPVLEDNSGNVWFAAHGMGLYQWTGKSFNTFSE